MMAMGLKSEVDSTGSRFRPVDVFIHSSDHSGSTWLGYVLGSSSESAFVGELFRSWDQHARVPCTVCASRGLSECVLLHGLEDLEPREVFSLISERSRKRMIIDNSKKIDWTRRFIDRPGRDLHVVHVVKDPRSRWASLRRRESGRATVEQVLVDWCAENQAIIDFVEEHFLPVTTVAYDIVAANQEQEIAALFAFLGLKFEARALRYWEIDHHGFAANGASSALIEHLKFDAPPKHFATADDAFYKAKFGMAFVDERWRTELPDIEVEAIVTCPRVASLLRSLGFQLTHSGIERLIRGGKVPLKSTAPASWRNRFAASLGVKSRDSPR